MNDRSIVRDNVYYFRPDYVLSKSDFACNTITDITANILHENSKTCRPIRCSVFRLHKTFLPSLPLPSKCSIVRLRWEKSKSIVGSSSILSTRIVIRVVIKFQTCLENSFSFFLSFSLIDICCRSKLIEGMRGKMRSIISDIRRFVDRQYERTRFRIELQMAISIFELIFTSNVSFVSS